MNNHLAYKHIRIILLKAESVLFYLMAKKVSCKEPICPLNIVYVHKYTTGCVLVIMMLSFMTVGHIHD